MPVTDVPAMWRKGNVMKLSRTSIEMLVDLVEIKMFNMMDAGAGESRAMAELEKCRRELLAIAKKTKGVQLVPLAMPGEDLAQAA